MKDGIQVKIYFKNMTEGTRRKETHRLKRMKKRRRKEVYMRGRKYRRNEGQEESFTE